ncbi:MAG: YjbF family lipoprotein [Paracoccaceae bacterium]
MIRWPAICAAVFLAACSSGGINPTIGAVIGTAKSTAAKLRADPATRQPGRQRLTRAMIEKAGLAMIRAQLGADAPANHLVAATKNGAYVTYLTRQGQQLTLSGSAITATRGIGHDLLAAASSPGDPLVVPAPPARWPATVRRSFRFAGDGPGGRVMAFDCRFARGGEGDITIVEIVHRTVRFTERCTNGRAAFENIHFADAKTGFVWRSRQWVSPRLPQIDFDVLEPLTGR